MNTREALELAENVLEMLDSGKEYDVYLRVYGDRDPASGRREWREIVVPLSTAFLIPMLQGIVRTRRRLLADELRGEADRLERSIENV